MTRVFQIQFLLWPNYLSRKFGQIWRKVGSVTTSSAHSFWIVDFYLCTGCPQKKHDLVFLAITPLWKRLEIKVGWFFKNSPYFYNYTYNKIMGHPVWFDICPKVHLHLFLRHPVNYTEIYLKWIIICWFVNIIQGVNKKWIFLAPTTD